jgi:uncharacterized protein YehS (DUF1456 family)
MTNNDLLRRLRYAFDFSNPAAIKLFSLDPANAIAMSTDDFKARLAKQEDENHITCSDAELAAFLDGLIVSKRGLREPSAAGLKNNPQDKPAEFRLSKNDILKKLRIAMSYRELEMLETLKAGGSDLSKAELGALFRNPKHKHYRACGNQVLRNFIKGLTATLRAQS